MTDISTTEVRLPRDVPPKWANSLMKWALTTPGLERMIGQGVALFTFTGHKTGDRYQIPVSYQRDDDTVTIITKKVRNWWRNFETPAEVELRLAGRVYSGKAEICRDEEANLNFMTDYLAKRPVDAKAYGLDKSDLAREKVARIIPHVVLIRIEIAPKV
jgi:hypothetical protein